MMLLANLMNTSLPLHWNEMSFLGFSPHGFFFEPLPQNDSYQLIVVHIRVYLGFPFIGFMLLLFFPYNGIYIYIYITLSIIT